MAKYIFSAIGGSGSTYLTETLSTKFIVGKKPDMTFNPILKEIGIDPGTFEERSKGFKSNGKESFPNIFKRYVSFLKKSKEHTAVFGLAAENHLFSKFKIRNVIFQIRHPLHAYVSLGKPYRHKEVIDYFGGLNSIGGVQYFGNRWNAICNEYLLLQSMKLSAGLIRFEFAHRDVYKFPELEWIYKIFDHSKRNYDILDKKFEHLLKEIVSESFFALYDDWSV